AAVLPGRARPRRARDRGDRHSARPAVHRGRSAVHHHVEQAQSDCAHDDGVVDHPDVDGARDGNLRHELHAHAGAGLALWLHRLACRDARRRSLAPDVLPPAEVAVRLLALCTAVLLSGCGVSAASNLTRDTAPRAEALSLLGQPLFAPAIDGDARRRMEAQLAEARAAYERQPNDADAIIWLGRRLAYLGYYRDAIEVFSEGIAKHPDDARFYRHRGHRFITTRQV